MNVENYSDDDFEQNEKTDEKETKRKTATVESEARRKKKLKKRQKITKESYSSSTINDSDVEETYKREKNTFFESMVERLEKSLNVKDTEISLLKKRMKKMKQDKQIWKEKFEKLEQDFHADIESNDGEELKKTKKKKKATNKYDCSQPRDTNDTFGAWAINQSRARRGRCNSTQAVWPSIEEINKRKKLPKIRKQSNLLKGNSKDRFTLPALDTVQPMQRENDYIKDNYQTNKNQSFHTVKLPKLKL